MVTCLFLFTMNSSMFYFCISKVPSWFLFFAVASISNLAINFSEFYNFFITTIALPFSAGSMMILVSLCRVLIVVLFLSCDVWEFFSSTCLTLHLKLSVWVLENLKAASSIVAMMVVINLRYFFSTASPLVLKWHLLMLTTVFTGWWWTMLYLLPWTFQM